LVSSHDKFLLNKLIKNLTFIGIQIRAPSFQYIAKERNFLISDEGICHDTAPELAPVSPRQLSAHQGWRSTPLTHLTPRLFERQCTLDRQTDHRADAKSWRSTHAGTGVNDGAGLERSVAARSQLYCVGGTYFPAISAYIYFTLRSNVMPINATKDGVHLRRNSRTGGNYR
jgi:hypothetical protein